MGTTAFLCSGQGAQIVGMGVDFADISSDAKALFEIADEVSGLPITEMCRKGPQEELSLTQNTQPSLVVTSLAIATVLEERGLKPDCVAGFSLGEYAAHALAGTISAKDALELVSRRGAFMAMAAQRTDGGMAALLRCDLQQATELCEKHAAATGQVLVPANLNCPGQVVISGQREALQAACDDWKERGGRASILATSGAFHSPLMESAADGMRYPLQVTDFATPKIPLYCNYTGKPLVEGEAADSLIRQVTSPVLWEETIRNMIGDGVTTFVECGPGKVLVGMVKRTARDMDADVELISIGTVADLEVLDV